MSSLGSAVNAQAKQLTGLKSQIVAVAGAYVGAQGAAKAFESTIAAAAKYELSSVTLSAMFDDKALSDSYMKMMDKVAIDSPLLNSTDMVSGSKGLVSLTKDLGTLEKAWKTVEKLNVLSPEAGVDGAVFAMKELASQDVVSMSERFNIPKKMLHNIKKLPFDQQLDALNGILETMNITDKVVEEMGSTTIGQWNSINERAETFLRTLGKTANSKIGAVLGGLIDKFDKFDTKSLAAKLDAAIGGALQKALDFGQLLWTWRDPIIATVKAVGKFVGVVAGIVAVVKVVGLIAGAFAFLTSPIGLIAIAIIGIVEGFKALYANSEQFRGAMSGIIDKGKELFRIFGESGVSGLLEAILPPDTLAKIKEVVDLVKSKASELFSAFESGGVSGLLAAIIPPEMLAKFTEFIGTVKTKANEFVAYLKSKWEAIQPGIATLMQTFTMFKDNLVNIFTSLWGFIQPVIGALIAAFMIVADVVVIAFNNVVAPVIRHVMATMQMLWKIIGPILKLIGAGIGTTFEVLRIVWDVIIKPFVNFMTTVFKKAIESALPIIEKIGGAFDVVGGVISKIAGWLNDFTSALKSFKVPNWLSKLGGGGTVKFEEASSDGSTKSHYNGIEYVPSNRYPAELHKGEAVLTAAENKERKQGGGGSPVSISGNTFNVRQESDIEAIAMKLARLIERERAQMT